MQYHVSLSLAKTTFNSFHIQMRKKKHPNREREGGIDRERGREIKRSGRCWHVYRQLQSPGVNMRDGEWHATEKRRRHTGVSEHSALGPMAEWCLRDKAEVYKRCRAPQGPRRLSIRLTFPLCSCIASQTEQAVVDILGSARSDLPPSLKSPIGYIDRSARRSTATKESVSHLIVMCSVTQISVEKEDALWAPVKTDLQLLSARLVRVALHFSFCSAIMNQPNSMTAEVDMCLRVC